MSLLLLLILATSVSAWTPLKHCPIHKFHDHYTNCDTEDAVACATPNQITPIEQVKYFQNNNNNARLDSKFRVWVTFLGKYPGFFKVFN